MFCTNVKVLGLAKTCPGSLPGMSSVLSLAMGATVEHMGGAYSRHTVASGLRRVTRVAHASEPRSYVYILYGSPCAPVLLPWLGEVTGTSIAMIKCKALPVPARILMFRVPTVLLRALSAVPPTAPTGARRHP